MKDDQHHPAENRLFLANYANLMAANHFVKLISGGTRSSAATTLMALITMTKDFN